MKNNKTPLFKMNGVGNKILVVDGRASTKPVTGKIAANLGNTEMLCFDQLMVIEQPKSAHTDAFIKIFNRDGSQAKACGNGTRCLSDVMMNAENRHTLHLETDCGVLAVKRRKNGLITVDMGEPKFAWQDIPLAEEFRDTRAIELQIGPIDAPVLHSPSVVNIGNSHAIFWVDNDVDRYGLERFGPLLENHPVFPEKANISLVQITARNEINLKVWERGVGLTLACGSAACAAVACGVHTERTERNVKVNLPGGILTIEYTTQNRLLLTGAVAYEGVGFVNLDDLDWELVETSNPFDLTDDL